MFSPIIAASAFALYAGQACASVQYGGVNIAGFDFGCEQDGSYTGGSSVQYNAPVTADKTGRDGDGQMAHFATDDKLNIFRLPVPWQYLVNSKLGGDLDESAMSTYDGLVKGCLDTGASCIIDIHNYARYDGSIVGQSDGAVTDEDLSSLWSQLATKYADDDKVIFGIMNEPHDLPDINVWAKTVQASVTAIRKAGATSQMILLPGNKFTSAASFHSSGSLEALSTVKNIDGTTDNLIFDVHQYLDSDNGFSGTSAECTTDAVSDSFSPLADKLKAAGRQAMVSEIGGGGSESSCLTNLCSTLDFLNDNSDVYIGYVGWAAGSFATDYVLSLTPSGDASSGWKDQPLMTQCFAAKFSGASSGDSPSGNSTTTTGSDTGTTATAYSTSTAPTETAVSGSDASTTSSSDFSTATETGGAGDGSASSTYPTATETGESGDESTASTYPTATETALSGSDASTTSSSDFSTATETGNAGEESTAQSYSTATKTGESGDESTASTYPMATETGGSYEETPTTVLAHKETTTTALAYETYVATDYGMSYHHHHTFYRFGGRAIPGAITEDLTTMPLSDVPTTATVSAATTLQTVIRVAAERVTIRKHVAVAAEATLPTRSS